MQLRRLRKGQLRSIVVVGRPDQPSDHEELLDQLKKTRKGDVNKALAAIESVSNGTDPRDVGEWKQIGDLERWRFGDLRIYFFQDGRDLLVIARSWVKDNQKERKHRLRACAEIRSRYFQSKGGTKR